MTEPPAAPPGRSLVRRVVIATVLGVIVFAALSLYADARTLLDCLGAFRWWTFGAGLLLATGNYALRFLRWEVYLRALGIRLPRGESALIFVAGFVMSITPAKVGEVLKSLLLHEARGIPIARTAPIVIAERLTDLMALVLLTAIGSFAFEEGIAIALAGGGLVIVLLVVCGVRPIGQRVIAVLGKLPLLRRIAPRLGEAYEALRTLLRPGPLAFTTLLSTASWFLECLCLLLIAHGLPGVRLDLLDATFAYAAPTVLGALALLPGGLGVTEVGMTGILQGLGLDPAAATAVTILVRLATLWWAVFLGILALARFRATRRLAPGGGRG